MSKNYTLPALTGCAWQYFYCWSPLILTESLRPDDYLIWANALHTIIFTWGFCVDAVGKTLFKDSFQVVSKEFDWYFESQHHFYFCYRLLKELRGRLGLQLKQKKHPFQEMGIIALSVTTSSAFLVIWTFCWKTIPKVLCMYCICACYTDANTHTCIWRGNCCKALLIEIKQNVDGRIGSSEAFLKKVLIGKRNFVMITGQLLIYCSLSISPSLCVCQSLYSPPLI